MKMNKTKYPDVDVQLVGQDGNALAIIGRVSTALKRAGVDLAEVDEYQKEAMSGDYNNVLVTSMKWVNVS